MTRREKRRYRNTKVLDKLFRAFPSISADENFFGSQYPVMLDIECVEIMKEKVVGVSRNLIISYLPASHGRL